MYLLLSLRERYDLLVREGHQFPTPNQTAQLSAEQSIDVPVMHGTGKFYADLDLQEHLNRLHGLNGSLRDGLGVIRRALASGTVWGVSGFSTGSTATDHYEYGAESAGLEVFYNYIKEFDQTSLVVDGGCSEGVLGLNGLLAQMHGIPSLGFTPVTRLTGMGVRKHMVLWGQNYPEREVLVGLTPHALLCAAGAEGTIRECEWALKYNTPVILLGLKDYDYKEAFPNVYESVPRVKAALAEGRRRFFYCKTEEEIPDAVRQALALSYAERQRTTNPRLRQIAARLLSSSL